MTQTLVILRFVGVVASFGLAGYALIQQDFAQGTFWMLLFYAGIYGQRDE